MTDASITSGASNPGTDRGEAPQLIAASQSGPGMMGVLGAAVSLALIVGLGIWGYKLAVRDVSGIPIVRAVEGPMRIQPDDPGGESAAFQGYSVNNVQAEGGTAAPADRLALAPRSATLNAEDVPASPIASISAATPNESAPARPQVENVTATEPVMPTDATAQMLALADQLADGVAPLSDTLTDITRTSAGGVQSTQDAANSAVAAALLEPQILSTSVPGLARSPRPAYRPAGLAQRASAQVAPTSQSDVMAGVTGAGNVREIAAVNIPVGTRLVQLGAFDSPDVARAEWDKLNVRFEDYMSGKTRVIQKATSGGKTFYRLRVLGFDGLSDARRFCAVFMNANAACIPVVTR